MDAHKKFLVNFLYMWINVCLESCLLRVRSSMMVYSSLKLRTMVCLVDILDNPHIGYSPKL